MRKEYVIKEIANGYVFREDDGSEVKETYYKTYGELLMRFADVARELMHSKGSPLAGAETESEDE